MKGLVRVTTYAKLLGVSRQYVHDLIKQEKLATIIIDGTIFLMSPDTTDNDNVNNNSIK